MTSQSSLRKDDSEDNPKQYVLDDEGTTICGESSCFLIPEDQISIEIREHRNKFNLDLDKELRSKKDVQLPFYLFTCYDEFTRNFITVNVGKNLSDSVPLIGYDPDIYNSENTSPTAPKSILQHYNPGFSQWYSTFRKIPYDSQHLMSGSNHSDTNYVIKKLAV